LEQAKLLRPRVFVSISKDFREKLDNRFDRIFLIIPSKKRIKIIKRRKEKKREKKKKKEKEDILGLVVYSKNHDKNTKLEHGGCKAPRG